MDKDNSFKSFIKKILQILYKPFTYTTTYKLRKQVDDLDRKLDEQFSKIIKSIDELKYQLDEFSKYKDSLSQQIDSRIWKAEENLSHQIDNRVWKAEENLSSSFDSRIWKTEENLSHQIDSRIWKAEENLSSSFDSRIWKTEESLGHQIDSRVWKAEENLSTTFDSRIWKTEENLAHQIDSRVWKAEENLSTTFDGRIWKTEENLAHQIDSRAWKAEENLSATFDSRIWETEENLAHQIDSRAWKAEENLSTTFDSRIWKTEENLAHQIDSRAWKAEIYLKKEILKRVWNIERKLSKIYSLNNSKDNNVSNDIYGDIFYEDNQYSSFVSGLNVLKKLLPELLPNSIIDFGCGTGTWLAAAKAINRNIEVVGVDGDYVNRDMLMIDESSFIPFDLTKFIDLGRKFDLAISLEVAEHIDEEYADNFIDNICRHSDKILFSAAHVGQGGDGHVNEQPIEYWIDKFSSRGYKWVDIREQFKNNPDIDWWYKDNMVLFTK